MTKAFLGEISAKIGRTYTLRPSFKALYAIEEECGAPINDLLKEARHLKLSLERVEYVLRQGAVAAGEPIEEYSFHPTHRIVAAKFLMAGLGYEPIVASMASEKHYAGRALDWPGLYTLTVGMLGCREEDFWNMTMHGLLLRLFADEELRRAGEPARALHANREELGWLMHAFPDAPGHRGA